MAVQVLNARDAQAAADRPRHVAMVSWVLVAFGVIASVTVGLLWRHEQQSRSAERLRAVAAETEKAVGEMLAEVEGIARSVRGHMRAIGTPTAESFEAFVNNLDLSLSNPAVISAAFIEPTEDAFVVRYSVGERAGDVVGNDLKPIPEIRPSLEFSRLTGRAFPALAVGLIEDTQLPGFAMLLPSYGPDSFEGWAAVVVDIDEAAQRKLQPIDEPVVVQAVAPDAGMGPIVTWPSEEAAARASGGLAVRLQVYGYPLAVDVMPLPEFVDASQRYGWLLVIGLGFVFSLLLFTVARALELRSAVARERSVSERLRDLDEMKNGFIAAVSHELRTPLTSVIGFAETLRARNADLSQERSGEVVERLVSNARRLERLLGDLLDVDRLARGVVEPRRRRVDIGALARHQLDGIDTNGHPVTVSGSGVVAAIDPAHAERIIENLVVNAVKHTPIGTPIWVGGRRVTGGVVLAVEDAGPGIPDTLKAQIFRLFVQGDHPAHAPGTGIGLALVARLAGLHGGSAWVEDRQGGGASFRVFLPDAPTGPNEPDALFSIVGREPTANAV